MVSIAKHMHHVKQRTDQAVVWLERSAIAIAVASFQDVVFFGAILPDEMARCCQSLLRRREVVDVTMIVKVPSLSAELDGCLVRASVSLAFLGIWG